MVDKANDIFLQKLEKKYNVTVKNNKQRGGISEVIITNENEVYVEKACFELAKNSEVLDVYPMNGYNEEEKIADKLISVYKLDEDDDDDLKPGVGKRIVTKRKDDLSKMNLKQLQKYIDKNWEEIYEVMKSGKLYPTYGFRINTNGMENFETITLSIDFTDNKEKSNVVRVATNFANKNPGLFIVLDRTYMSFAVLKSEDIIEFMSPLIKKLASLGYGTIIKGIFGKNISKLVKIFNDEEKNSAYKNRENWTGSIDNPVIYIGSYDIKNIDKNIDKISSYAKKLDGYAFINKKRSGMRRYLIEVEFNNEDNFLKLAKYIKNDLGVKIDYIMDAVNSNDRDLSYKIAKKIEKTLKINIDEEDTQDDAVKPSYALYPSKGKLREVEEAISEIKNLTVSVYPLEKKINIQSYTDGVINNTLKVVKEVDPKCELMEAWSKKTVPIKNYRIDEADTSNRIFIIANYLSTEESSEVINRGAYIEKYFPNVNVKIKKTTKGLEVRVDSTELEEIKEFFYQMVYEYAYELYNYTITTGRGTYEASELKKYLDRELLNVNPLDEDGEDLYNISLDVEINHYNVSEPEKTLHNIEKLARNNNVSFDLTNWETDVADYAISGDTYSNIEKVFKALVKAGIKITNYTFNKEYSKDKKAIRMNGYKMLDKYVNKKSSKVNPLNEEAEGKKQKITVLVFKEDYSEEELMKFKAICQKYDLRNTIEIHWSLYDRYDLTAEITGRKEDAITKVVRGISKEFKIAKISGSRELAKKLQDKFVKSEPVSTVKNTTKSKISGTTISKANSTRVVKGKKG